MQYVKSDRSRTWIRNRYPAAAVIVHVIAGWLIFETQQEYLTWRNQK